MYSYCHAKHCRSGIWSAANGNELSCVMVKKQRTDVICLHAVGLSTDACLRGVLQAGLSRVRVRVS